MAYPGVMVEIFVGGQWVDITADCYLSEGGKIGIAYGRAAQSARVTTASARLKIRNPDGTYTPDNPLGRRYGQIGLNTKIRISVTPFGTVLYRLTGRVAAWPQEWHRSGKKVWAPIEISGILRAYEKGTPALTDALRRHIEVSGPLRYWSLTDGDDARQGTEHIAGGQPMRSVGETGSFYQGQPQWGRGNLATWLASTVQIPSGTTGRLSARLRPASITSWAVDHYRAGIGSSDSEIFDILDTGEGTDADPFHSWGISTTASTGNVVLFVVVAGETTSTNTTLATITSPGIYNLSPHMIRFTAADDGASGTNWTLIIDGAEVASGNQAITTRVPSRIRYRWFTAGNDLALGHIVYWGETVPDAADTWRAVRGHDREPAGRRIERLCIEEGVTLRVNGSLDDTQLMGPQKPGGFLDLLGTCTDVDGGVLYEARDDLALEYRTNRSKYNQGV